MMWRRGVFGWRWGNKNMGYREILHKFENGVEPMSNGIKI